MSDTRFKKGCTPWNKGKKCPEISERQMGEKNHRFGKHTSEYQKIRVRESNSGEKNSNWKGDKVGYRAIHNWVESKLGEPKYCEQCKRTDRKKYEWANVDHKYARVVSEYMRLCTSCHKKYDYKMFKK